MVWAEIWGSGHAKAGKLEGNWGTIKNPASDLKAGASSVGRDSPDPVASSEVPPVTVTLLTELSLAPTPFSQLDRLRPKR